MKMQLTLIKFLTTVCGGHRMKPSDKKFESFAKIAKSYSEG